MALLITIGGGGGVGPVGPPGPAGVGTYAPNVTATATAFLEEWANSQRFGFTGTINLPTSDPDYTHLVRIDVFAIGPDAIAHLIATFTDWGVFVTTLDYYSTVDVQPNSDESWDVQFVCYNENGAASPSPYTISSISVGAAVVSSVTAAEVASSQYQDENQGLHTVISIVPVAGALPIVVTFWFDFADGRGWVWQGWRRLTTVGQTILVGEQTVSNEGIRNAGTIWVPTDPTMSGWKVAAIAGAVFETSTPPAGYVEYSFTVSVAGAALSDDVINAFFTNDPVTSVPISYTKNDVGTLTWHFYQVNWTQPSIVSRPSFKNSFITVQKGAIISGTWTPAPDREGVDEDPGGQYLGRRVTDGGPPLDLPGVVIYKGTTWPDWTYPPNKNADTTTNLYRTFRFRIYSQSRRGENVGGGTGVITLNSCWPGGATYFDLTPDPHPNFVSGALSGGDGSPVIISPNGITSVYIDDDAIIARHMAADSITAANAAIAANAVVDPNIVSLGINKVTYGTSIFAGDVVLSRGISQPVIVLKNTGLYLFGQADASTGATGLTSKPYVAVESTGITVFSGANPSVTITSVAITMWSVNGNTSNPYVSASSAGIVLASSGANTLALTSSGLSINDGGGTYLQATSSTITMVKGTSSVTITASGVTIVNGILTSPAITVTGGAFTVNIDTTDSVKITGNGIITQLNNSTGTTGRSAGLKISDTSGTSRKVETDVFGVYVYDAGGILGAYVSAGSGKLGLFDNSLGGTVEVETIPPRIKINGTQVLGARVAITPTTLADVISIMQTMGFCN